MKNLLISLFLFLLACNPSQDQSKFSDQNQFKWLEGYWEAIKLDSSQSGFEIWESLSGGEMNGFAVSMVLGDTVFTENLAIVKKDSLSYYLADVAHNPNPILFEITETSKSGFICKNDSHDFPKKITYQLDEEILHVEISGDGQKRDFYFARQQGE